MTDTPDMFECRLVGYSKQSRKDGDWVEVRFHIHPDDVTPALAQAPLKTVFMVAATPAEKAPKVEISDRKISGYAVIEDAPKEKPKRSWDEIPLPEQAGIRCNDPQFQDWLGAQYGRPIMSRMPDGDTVTLLKAVLCIASRSALSPDNEAGKQWLALDEEYRQSQGLIAERTT